MSNQANTCVILHRLENLVKGDESFSKEFSEYLGNPLDEMNYHGDFGKYGQNDPRGNYKNGKWSMDNIEAQ